MADYTFGRDVDDVVINSYGMPYVSGTLTIYGSYDDALAGTGSIGTAAITNGRREYTADLDQIWVVAPGSKPYVVNASADTVALTTDQLTDMTAIGRSLAKATSQAAARAAIGAGTSSFDGKYSSLTGTPAIPSVAADVGAVPVSRKVNGQALSADVTITLATLGAASAAQGSKADTAVQPNGSITGNAATATKLATGRKISGVTFDGTADITITPANIGAATAAQGAKADTAVQKITGAWSTAGISADSTNVSGGWSAPGTGGQVGINVRNNDLVTLAIGFTWSGAALTGGSDGNLADQNLGTITDTTLRPPVAQDVIIGRSGYPSYWGCITEAGVITLVACCFPGQTLANGTGLRIWAQWPKI